MAIEKQVALLMRGPNAWNRWRKKNPAITPDLNGAALHGPLINIHTGDEVVEHTPEYYELCIGHAVDYKGLDLEGADLSETDLSDCYLRRANLKGANLEKSNCSKASLEWACIVEANVVGCDFSEARMRSASLSKSDLTASKFLGSFCDWASFFRSALRGADFSEAQCGNADFRSSDLTGASFQRADLDRAKLYETIFGDTDLSSTHGLASCEFLGPCTLDNRTLKRSWPLPAEFLRGCGLDDRFISAFKGSIEVRPQYHSCFISYSNENRNFAEKLLGDLQSHGVRCWFAPHDMPIGARLRDELDLAIRRHEKLLLVLSEESVASRWVEKEVETAFEEESRQELTILFPIMIDRAVLEADMGWAADIRRTRNIGDFGSWFLPGPYQVSLRRLLRDLLLEPKDSSETDG